MVFVYLKAENTPNLTGEVILIQVSVKNVLTDILEAWIRFK